MSDDIRSAVAASFDKVESSAPAAPAPTEAPSTPAPVEASAPAPVAETPATEAAPEAPSASAAPANGGDKPGQSAPTVPPESTPAAPKVPEVKAPQSWKPALREHWAKVPPEIQAEVVRREREVQSALQEASEAKRTAGAFQQVLSPYMGMIQAEGQDPIKAVAGLLQTAAALRTAPPAHKAALVAQIITGYGISTEDINAVLQGQQPAQGQPQAPQHFDPEAIARQAEERVRQSFAQQARQHQMRQADSELQTFISSGEAEFFEDVRPIMASLMEAAAKSGIALTIKDAYAQAVAMSPDLKPVLQQRSEAAQRASQVAAAQRAKAAASSIKTTPAPIAATAPATMRGDIEAAIAKASGR